MAEFHDFTLPSGVTCITGNTFNPDFGLDLERGYPFLDPQVIEDEANVYLAKYGIEPIQKGDYDMSPDYIAAEVGDDEETASASKVFIAFQLCFHNRLGVKVSWSDTSISPRYGNFAEDLLIVPDGYGQTYLNARNSGSPECMSFLDVPKLRLATDIRPMKMDHSSTNDGKASMIGARMEWIPLSSPIRATYEVFNLFQDINLGLNRDKRFPYMPSSLGGHGKAIPFRYAVNLQRFMKSYKQGSYSRLISNIIHRTVDFISKLENGESPAKDPLLSHVVRFQSSFHDWVKGRSIYAPVTWYDVPPGLEEFRAGKLGESSVKDDVFGRLIAERKLLTEQQLQIAVEHNELCKALIKTESILSFKKLRDEARTSFRNLSIFSQINYGYIKELSLVPNTKDKSFDSLDVLDIQEFMRLVKLKRYNLRHILGEEFVYFREAMDEIYRSGPMKVYFTMTPLNKVYTRSFAGQRSEYSSDYECTETIGALTNLYDWCKGGFQGPPPREIINDDNSIIQECYKQTYNIIVTNDKKLCREATNKTGNVIFRVPTLWYYKVLYFGTKHYTDFLTELLPGKTFTEHVDTGSVQSFEETNFRDGVMLRRQPRTRLNVFKKLTEKDREQIEEYEDFSDDPPERIEDLFYDKFNLCHFKRAKYNPRLGKGSSSSNWRH